MLALLVTQAYLTGSKFFMKDFVAGQTLRHILYSLCTLRAKHQYTSLSEGITIETYTVQVVILSHMLVSPLGGHMVVQELQISAHDNQSNYHIHHMLMYTIITS